MNEQSDTPRTDANVAKHRLCRLSGNDLVYADFARQLERELTAARAEVQLKNLRLDAVKMERDRLAALLQEACDDPNIGNWYHAAQKALQSLTTNEPK
jgi:hypothetical protein